MHGHFGKALEESRKSLLVRGVAGGGRSSNLLGTEKESSTPFHSPIPKSGLKPTVTDFSPCKLGCGVTVTNVPPKCPLDNQGINSVDSGGLTTTVSDFNSHGTV